MATATSARQAGLFETRVSSDRTTLTLLMKGRLDANTTGRLWREAQHILERSNPIRVVIDASEMNYCDGAGVAFLVKLQQYQARIGGDMTIHGLREEFRRLLDIYGQISRDPPPGRRRELRSVVEKVGHAALGLWHDIQTLLTFVGELTVALLRAARHPRLVRWSDAWLIAERVGVDALPIIALIGILLGLILAFQSAIPMRQFGAETVEDCDRKSRGTDRVQRPCRSPCGQDLSCCLLGFVQTPKPCSGVLVVSV